MILMFDLQFHRLRNILNVIYLRIVHLKKYILLDILIFIFYVMAGLKCLFRYFRIKNHRSESPIT